MSNRWRLLSIGLLIVAMIQFGLLVREGGTALLKSSAKMPQDRDGFDAFEGISFAREFSERYESFNASNFRSTQTATAFLLDDDSRPLRLAEIDRLAEKIERRDVTQKARLVDLLKLPGPSERFRADLDVELSEGAGTTAVSSRFRTRLEFSVTRVTRSEQNPWGFHVRELTQSVLQSAPTEAQEPQIPTFVLRPNVAMLVRFPCSIENVELPKSTSIRVKLTTLDISELQMKSETALIGAQTIRAICRERVFTMKIQAEKKADDALLVFKSLTLGQSTSAVASFKKKKRRKTDVEKSIEDQLGFVVEEE